MAEQLHKGWLNTRENEKFAPATLATQIYNEDGTSFYRTVSNYIEAQEALSDAVENLTTVGVADLRTDLNAEIEARAAKDQELESRLQYFNGSADNALYIIDKNANVIAYVDGSGVNSTDFTIPTSGIRLSNVAAHVNDLQGSVESILTKLAYFDGAADNAFYIVDNNKNVIAYIDESGVHSTNFFTTETDFNSLVARINAIETTDLSAINAAIARLQDTDAALSGSIETLTGRLSYFNGDADDTLYIVDRNRNVIAYVRDGGVYSVDFHPKDGRSVKELDNALTIHQNEFNSYKSQQTSLDNQQNNSINALNNSVETLANRLSHFNGDADDAFYIIDKNKNVIAYIREGGVYSTNFTLKDGRNLVTLYDDYERILTDAETYNTFNTIETWIEGTIETLKSHTQSLKDLGDSIEDIVEAVGLPSDEANYPGYETKPANLYEAVIENRTDINVLNGEVTQKGSVAKAIDDLHKEILDGASADYQTLKKVETAIEVAKERLDTTEDDIDDIQELIGEATDTTDATLLGKININVNNIASNDEDISELQQNTQYFNGSADDALYIVDKTEDHNVIAVVNGQGVKSIDFTTPDAGLNATAASLAALTGIVEEFNSEVGIPEEPDYDDPTGSLYKQVVKNKDDIAVIMGTEDGSIEHAVTALETKLLGDATTYKTFGRVEDEIGLNYTAGDNTVKGKIQTNADNITATNNVIGEYPTTAGFPASKTVFQLIENNYNEIAILTAGSATPGSVAYQIAQVVAGADEGYDTLKEIADWIIAHPEDVAAMWEQITRNQGDIKSIYDVIGTKSGEDLADPNSDTIWANIEDINRVFNNDSDDTIYVVDKDKNVVAYFNQNGLTTTNVVMSNTALNHSIRGLGYNEEQTATITLNFDI